jgi:hypothetical protein
MPKVRPLRADECERIELHTACPRGYVQWHEWAERMSKTHKQKRCPACGLWSIWVPRATTTDKGTPE